MKSAARIILDPLLPAVLTAGRYARAIQSRVTSQAPKEQYDSPFAQALTDADLSVQSFLEVAALAKFPDVGFFGEECAQSLNMKYFSDDAECTLLLDPVDGTRYYKDGQELFSVILSLVDRQQMIGAAVYLPCKDDLYVGYRGEGTFYCKGAQFESGQQPKQVQLSPKPSNILLTYDLPFARQALEKEFTFIDIITEYTPNNFQYGLPSQLEGTVGCMVRKGGSLIDWGAFAFLAEAAGGIVSDFSGNPLPPISACTDYMVPEVLISNTPEIHERALRGLAA